MCRLNRLILLAAVLLAAGCSTTKLAYDNLDWIVSWQIGKFVTLNEPQKTLLDDRFKSFWQWHRSTQLALYVKDLRELADLMSGPVTHAQVADYLQRMGDHGKRAFNEALPELTRLMQTMDDKQVAEMLKHMADKREEQVRKDSGLSVEEQQDRAVEDTEDSLDRWLGSVTPAQEQRLHDWAVSRRYENAVWHNYQDSWAAAFAALLAQRQDAAFPDKLKALFDEPDLPSARAIADVRSHNRAVWIAMMADLSQTLTPDQRAHSQKKLRTLAKDLEELAAEPVKT